MLGGSPGLVVMGGDSCFEGCGFESHHRILDGYLKTTTNAFSNIVLNLDLYWRTVYLSGLESLIGA